MLSPKLQDVTAVLEMMLIIKALIDKYLKSIVLQTLSFPEGIYTHSVPSHTACFRLPSTLDGDGI